ncbi:hypothetical protein GCM10022252_66620 [Streptosporangium oxazolinicum]|uniref:Secreted protein n=1 Tax=Streptosporangium oxazolinicum TaxID=909287 RepID=A0ABP8BFJ8_9ACTN
MIFLSPCMAGSSCYAVGIKSSDRFRIAQIFRTQEAQSPPAPVASRIWRALLAPAEMQSCTSFSVTARQTHTYTGCNLSGDYHRLGTPKLAHLVRLAYVS